MGASPTSFLYFFQRGGVRKFGSVSTLPVLAKKDLLVLSIYAFGISKPKC
ncbi:protein of unknown function [Petrocella atlantisensis]|uniref:Uncharacterized protein n=1 Tax=Petrocella atlantisensis TaxID=2173034 RepID=A0A3P7S392_9FIRM|nr:protein of unknown function [Petrocella atlantisensis]